MILVTADVFLQPGKHAEFIAAANTCIAATRNEEGNLSYRLLADPEDNAKYTFVEEWASQQALDAHMQAPHFAAFGAAIGPLAAAPLAIKVYSAELVQG